MEAYLQGDDTTVSAEVINLTGHDEGHKVSDIDWVTVQEDEIDSNVEDLEY